MIGLNIMRQIIQVSLMFHSVSCHLLVGRTTPLIVMHNLIPHHIPLLDNSIIDDSLLSVSLRHDEAIAALNLLASTYPKATIGASTVSSVDQAAAAIKAGAKFLSSVDTIKDVIDYTNCNDIPLLCGVQSIIECNKAIEYGASVFKIYPVVQIGLPTTKAMVDLIRHRRGSEATIFAAGGVASHDFGLYRQYGIDNIAKGYNMSKLILPMEFLTECEQTKLIWHHAIQQEVPL